MRFLLLLIACGDNPTTMQQTMPDLSAAAVADMAVVHDLAVPPGSDLTVPPGDFSVGNTDMAMAANTDMAMAKKRVFVTSGTWTGDLKTHGGGTDGLDGANKLCQMAATNAGLGGTWVAWLSDSTHDAKDRIADVGPWYRVDGQMVFANKAALTGTPMVAINLTENGAMPGGTAAIPFTGTDNGGTKNANTCTDWTVNTGNGECGSATMNTAGWTQTGAFMCSIAYSLYCFEQ
jgi:hypothetical protein